MCTQELYRRVNGAVCADVRALARTLLELTSGGAHDTSTAASPPSQAHNGADATSACATEAAPDSSDPEAAAAAQREGPSLGRMHAAVRASDAPAATAPYEAPKWLAGRAPKPSAQRRTEWLEGLEPWRPGDGHSAAELRCTVAQSPSGAGFELSRRNSGVDHPDAGLGVWLEGRASMGALVGLQPGVSYPEVYHECAPAPLQPHA